MLHSVEIKAYKKWLIITVIKFGPKIKSVGTGLLFSDFNKLDLQISEDAMIILKDNLNLNLAKPDPVLEIMGTNRIWWASNQSIIIPPNEYFHIYTIPRHTVCPNNDIDEKIKKIIDEKNI